MYAQRRLLEGNGAAQAPPRGDRCSDPSPPALSTPRTPRVQVRKRPHQFVKKLTIYARGALRVGLALRARPRAE